MSGVTLERLQLQHDVDQLNVAYAAVLDDKRFEAWPDFFLEDGRYTVQARENFDRGLPLALMDLESRGMMKDRVYGITQTIYHGPYYMRHVISAAKILSNEAGVITAQTNYAVFRTKPAGVSEVYNVGRYVDELVATDGGLKFRRRLCVYDSEMILNSLIYPV
ncbi:aromatic-ring-hydroxylating dioxygenase subunit beta [Polaromonas sp. SM01]|uniref:aromatic-ring-hydroxylating dioxygenase subunit beta n=1 Tax=Polaromonas sp. SM01 TaxID=3085630 RepID=UPI0029816DD8|nr:aromatic-ring-hydroxylating dioxygenase subunit beta [Polaromonas sp. SM01]MDW5444603.1 aromatic-ring-hydroxylating dioxygenase subunit beta [Polaromonas sp. SM01]